jgi:D-3-phosphoglycerate dehydrogenase
MAPKVLVSDKLSETAVQIFRDRGIDVDFMPDVGKDKEKLAEIIGQYDGLAIRSATKVTEKISNRRQPQGDRPRRDRHRQCRQGRRLEEGRDRDEHALRQHDHHRRTRHRDDVRRGPADPRGQTPRPMPASGKSRFMGVELTGKTLGVIGAGNIGGIVCDRARG